MKLFAPNYYEKFSCIAGRCKHSCCIGWEIDIDDDTYKKYINIDTEFGKKLNSCIEFDGEIASFKLCDNERCPFLNEMNLCDIILNLGENSLCQICNDHPRFRNYFSDRTEIGLGLCCEEAARIILTQNEPFEIVELSDENEIHNIYEDETEFFKLRSKIFEIVNSNCDFEMIINNILNFFNIKFPKKSPCEWADIYSGLERLDGNWSKLLNNLKTADIYDFRFPSQHKNIFTNLFTYFIYRHLGESVYDGNFNGRLLFAILSCYMIGALSEKAKEINDIIEIARMYSSEIEYSDENLEKLIELLQNESPEL